MLFCVCVCVWKQLNQQQSGVYDFDHSLSLSRPLTSPDYSLNILLLRRGACHATFRVTKNAILKLKYHILQIAPIHLYIPESMEATCVRKGPSKGRPTVARVMFLFKSVLNTSLRLTS